MQKVGAYLNKKEIVKGVLEHKGGIAKTADFTAEGMKNYDVAALCKEGFIERIRRGVYQFPQGSQTTEEQLFCIKFHFFCVLREVRKIFIFIGCVCVNSLIKNFVVKYKAVKLQRNS